MEIVARFQNLGRGKETRRSLLSDRGGGATKFWSGREKEEEALQIEIKPQEEEEELLAGESLSFSAASFLPLSSNNRRHQGRILPVPR